MYKISNVLWGLVLIAIGIIFGVNSLGIADINIFFDGWWTLFIIIPCFISLFKDDDKMGDFIGLMIGVFLLLGCQNILKFETIIKLIVPAILILIGLSIIFKDTINSKVKKEIKKLNKGNLKEYCATFSGQNVDYSDEKFEGCSLTAVFGAVKCDLRDAIIKDDTIINVSAVFGGITILVPDNVNIKISSTPIFGGVSDERKNKTKDNKITIYINATCMFGGVEVK